jgi:hypothetical protein
MDGYFDREGGWYDMAVMVGIRLLLGGDEVDSYQAAFWLFCFAVAVQVYDGEAGSTFNKC